MSFIMKIFKICEAFFLIYLYAVFILLLPNHEINKVTTVPKFRLLVNILGSYKTESTF